MSKTKSTSADGSLVQNNHLQVERFTSSLL